jgi:hypothetical protein
MLARNEGFLIAQALTRELEETLAMRPPVGFKTLFGDVTEDERKNPRAFEGRCVDCNDETAISEPPRFLSGL